LGVDADPGSSRLAVLGSAATGFGVRLYDSGSWQTINIDGITDYIMLSDVAVTASGLYLLALRMQGTESWQFQIYSYDGSWTKIEEFTKTLDALTTTKLSAGSNDRLSLGVIGGITPGQDTNYRYYIWHEKADGTYRTGDTAVGTNYYPPIDLQRGDSETHAAYNLSNQVKLWSFTDGADSNQNMQATTGEPLYLTLGIDPSDDSKVFWASAHDNSYIYYGDNYGTANGGSQHYDATLDATGLLGVGLAGDNESVFYWTDENANDVQHLLGHDTTANAGAGETYTVGEGIGYGGGGGGAHFSENAETGVYAIANEVRDGELTGYFMVDGAPSYTSTVLSPSGSADILQHHQALSLGGAVLALSEQQYATALSSYADSPGQTYNNDYIGVNNWCIPQAACTTTVANEYFTGGYTPSIIDYEAGLVINRYNWGTAEGTEELYVAGTTLANLEHNTVNDEILLCYTTSTAQDIVVREWSGAAWSGETVVYNGSTTIEALVLRHNAAGDWGLALLSDTDEVRLVEAPGGVWGASILLSSEPVNGAAGIGLAYNADGDLCVVVERDDATPGLYLGIKPDGGSIGWEKLVDTDGTGALSIYAYYHMTDPLLLYYSYTGTFDSSRMHTTEKLDGIWYDNEYSFHMHGKPVDAFLDASNNIIMAGYSRLGATRRAAVAILYP